MEETSILHSDYAGRKFCVTVLMKTFKLVSQRVVINVYYFQNGPHNVPRKKAINFYTKYSPHIHTERKYDTFFNNDKVHSEV